MFVMQSLASAVPITWSNHDVVPEAELTYVYVSTGR